MPNLQASFYFKQKHFDWRSKLLCFILILTSYSLSAQAKKVTLSGMIEDRITKIFIPYATIAIKNVPEEKLISVGASNGEGRFVFADIPSGNYTLEIDYMGYKTNRYSFFVGSLSDFLDLGTIEVEEDVNLLNEVVVSSKQDQISEKMDKKVYSIAENITQAGGSVLQAMQNLPGVTVQDGKVLLRGNDKITVLIDGKQTALTGFGSQSGLDNIASSSIEKIEIINNPSARFDANGNAGIINIIYKKMKQEGLNGKMGLSSGYGALWQRKENLPSIRPQYQMTPKINPSLSLNYKKENVNLYFQGDYLYTETLNKNEFVERIYNDGTIINQQSKRNRNTHFATIKTGVDWTYDDDNTLSFSGLFGSEKIIDNGDQPFFNHDYSERLRLWQFLEDELKTTVMVSSSYQHKFKEAGHLLNAGINYTFHREDENYFFDNRMPDYTGRDSFKLLSDESVLDINIDYIKPLKNGRLETGFKFRNRLIPTNMQFYPGINSPLDSDAGGKATYEEAIPAVYGNYVFETSKIEAEVGLRMEYLDLEYEVNPNHPTYKTDGYSYFEPFPTVRFAYKPDDDNKFSLFYNRRVDRPNEVDIRIFPKYDDAEIIKVGNPTLRPQFTNSVELGYRTNINKGYLFASLYSKLVDGTITRIATTTDNSNLIYNVFQNAGKSTMLGIEMVYSKEVVSWYSFNLNINAYHNTINPFTVESLYPVSTIFSGSTQEIFSGNLKWNNTFALSKNFTGQLSSAYLAPDIIPQGKMDARFSVDLGVKKTIQKGRGEIFINATDLFNTLVIKKEIQGDGFSYKSKDYYETQVIRFGYGYKF